MAEITPKSPESIELGFERINNPEVKRTPQQAETDALMQDLERGVTIERTPNAVPIDKYLERKPTPEVTRISDETQRFVDRFEKARDHNEAVQIMNEVLSDKRIPPDELTILIEKSQEAANKYEAAV